MVLERKDFDSDYEYLVCCMARDIYKHRKKDPMVPVWHVYLGKVVREEVR